MTDVDELTRRNEELEYQLGLAQQTMRALIAGQVDSVAAEAGSTPVLLRESQERLREREQVLRAIFDGALDAMLLFDDQFRCVDVNPAACAVFGIPKEQMLGRVPTDFAAEGYPVLDAMRGFMEVGRHRGDFPIVRPDGEARVLDLSSVANILPGLHFSVMRDVTEQRRSEEARNRLAAIVEGSRDAIIGTDLAGVVRSWNRAAEALFGYSAEEIVGCSVSALTPEHGAEDGDLLGAIARGEPIRRIDTIRRHKDGSLVEVAVATSPICDAHGRLVGASKIAHDLTDRRQAEAALRRSEDQLRQAQKMEAIGSLAGGVAHDFNNLLSVILGYTNMLLDDLSPSDPMREEIDEIHRAGERAAGLTRQLLAFSRQQMLEPSVIELNRVVDGVHRMLGRVLGEDIVLTLLRGNDVGKVYADRGQLEQVLMNLVVNARDAMPSGGHLTIETANVLLDAEYAAQHHGVTPGRHVLLAVSDTGGGMSRETVARIFDPFFTTKEDGKGTGLGLATVHGIVEQSGGHIWVYSEPGQGTTFRVYLPETDRAVEHAAVTALVPAHRGDETILLVEDEEQVRTVARSILRKHGYRVVEAQNAGEALLVMEKFAGRIDLLLTDVVMPRMNGRELAERLCAQRPDLKVLYMSGYTRDATVQHGMLDSGIWFLQKPLTAELLARRVREVLDGGPRSPKTAAAGR